MGIDNRARREAKRRKRARVRAGRAGSPPREPAPEQDHWTFEPHAADPPDRREELAATLREACWLADVDRAAARRYAERLGGAASEFPSRLVREAVTTLLSELAVGVLRGGWTPSDLAEITRRRRSAAHVPTLAGLLSAEAARHSRDRVSPDWLADLDGLGAAPPPDLESVDGLEVAIGLCVVLSMLPRIREVLPPPGARTTDDPGRSSGRSAGPNTGGRADAKLLSRVRSLLAKAESTSFPEEAEALSAKAQELISRYQLERLIEQDVPAGTDVDVLARRIWIDPPYVLAKAMLIGAVASANRCHAVVIEALGFSTVIGEARDLEAVELLATSLLVQADTAMLQHGRQSGAYGTSRTRSFRRAFLVAYAGRIGERLRAATEEATRATGRAGELVPLLAERAERVAAARDEIFPRLVAKPTSISNGQGWAAGRAAADLARLGVREAVVGQATSELQADAAS